MTASTTGQDEPTDEFWETGLILRVRTGSRAYGIALDSSDEDSRGVCIPPVRFLLGLDEFEQHESEGKDHVTYSLAKFARLALQGNPNIIETLYTPSEHLLHVDERGERLRAVRDQFLSRRAGERFGGYAQSQLGRLERHRKWLTDPPLGAPDPMEYGAEVVDGQLKFLDARRRKNFDVEQKRWNHYRTWRDERNEARAELEAEHGYDTKHAVHLIRLLRMGEEVLTRGEVLVARPDADELIALRHGEWPFEKVLEEATRRSALLPKLVAASSLPEQPNRDRIHRLVIELHLASVGGSTPWSNDGA